MFQQRGNSLECYCQNLNCIRKAPKKQKTKKYGNKTSQMRSLIGMLRTGCIKLKKKERKERKVSPCEFREVWKEFQNKLEALMF